MQIAPENLELLRGSGNSRIYRVVGSAIEPPRILKKYFSDGERPITRAKNEFRALSYLWSRGVRNIPEPLSFDEPGSGALYSFVRGEVLTGSEAAAGNLEQLADFLLELTRLSGEGAAAGIGPAAEARFRLRDHEKGISERLNRIMEGCKTSTWGASVRALIDSELLPLRDAVFAAFHERAERERVDLDRELPRNERVLSPSDFGLHNMLVDPASGRATFLDFEYFGFDDPAKMLADCFHSAAMSLSWEQKWFLMDRFSAGLSSELREGFLRRWALIIDLIGLEWILIVLNVAVPEIMKRKKFADPSLNEEKLVELRLKKAQEMVDSIKSLGSGEFLTARGRR